MDSNKSTKLIYIFLLLQPIIDLFTSLTTRFSELILKEEENYLAIKDKEAIKSNMQV